MEWSEETKKQIDAAFNTINVGIDTGDEKVYHYITKRVRNIASSVAASLKGLKKPNENTKY